METEMKQITFSKNLLKKAEIKAMEYGLTFNEYVRHLVVNDTTQFMPELSEESEKMYDAVLRDVAKGDYIKTKGPKETKKYLKKILNV